MPLSGTFDWECVKLFTRDGHEPIKYFVNSYNSLIVTCPLCRRWGRLRSDSTDSWGDRRFLIYHREISRWCTIYPDNPHHDDIEKLWKRARGKSINSIN